MTETINVKNIGLRGVIVADTRVSFIDGEKGILVYRGYRIEDLAEKAGGTDMVSWEDIDNLASWHPDMADPGSIPFMPSRVVLQDFTGEPALVDLAALRAAVARDGGILKR